MISFHWAQGFALFVDFGLGVVLGRIWALPPDQAMNLTSLLVGIVFGLVGIAVTIWLSAWDRPIRFEGLQRDIADVRGSIGSLHSLVTQMWSPVLQAIATGAFGTGGAPTSLSTVTRESSKEAPTQAAEAAAPAQQGGTIP